MENPAQGGVSECRSGKLDTSDDTRTTHDLQPLAGPRYEHMVEHLHSLGPRPFGELLIEIATTTGEPALIARHLEEFARLDAELIRYLGGDRFPPMPLQVMP